MAPIVKARGSFTGDKTMMGDAHLAWESVVKDTDHGHFVLCVYDKIADKITVQKSGVSPETHSSHDVIAEEMQLLADQKTACWGAYSWKAVQNTKPGQKEHSYHTACVLCIPKGCPDVDLIQKVKNRVNQVVFQPVDVYLEVNDPTYVDDPEFWMRKRAVHPDGTTHADFGGGHLHEQEECPHEQHIQEITKRRRSSASAAEERKSQVIENMEAERRRKVDLWQRAARLAEGLRKKNQHVALKSMDQEQARRIKEEGKMPSNGHEERFSKLKDELTGHEAEVKAERASKKQSREQVHADALERQKELAAEWNKKDETMDALREQNASLCKRILGAEQQRRCSNHEEEYIRSAMAKEFTGSIRHELVEAHELMERGVNQRGAKLSMDQEKRERCLDTTFASPELQKQKASVQDELRKSVRKSAAIEM